MGLDYQVRLQLFTLAYNLGNFLRRLVLPRPMKRWVGAMERGGAV